MYYAFAVLAYTVAHQSKEVHDKVVTELIDYSPLWKTMKAKGITQYQLLKQGLNNRTLDALKKNKNITMLTLEQLCKILDCTPNDVIDFKD